MKRSLLSLFVLVAAGLPGAAQAQDLAEALATARLARENAGEKLKSNDRAAACEAIERGLAAIDRADAGCVDANAFVERWFLADCASSAGRAPGAPALAVRGWRGVVGYLARLERPEDRQLDDLQRARRSLIHALELRGETNEAVELQRTMSQAAQARHGAATEAANGERSELVRLLLAGKRDKEAREEARTLQRDRKLPDPEIAAERLLAEKMAKSGRVSDALVLFREIAKQTTQKHGENSLAALLDRENIAVALATMKQYEAAYEVMGELLAAYEKHYPGSVEHLGALRNFVAFLTDQGAGTDPRTLDYLRQAMAGYESLRAKGQPVPVEDIETCRWELGMAANYFGDLLLGRELAEESMNKLLAAGMPLRATWARGVVAMSHRALGDLARARQLFEENERIRREALSPNDTDLMLVQRKLAECLIDSGEHERGITILRDVVQALEALPEPNLMVLWEYQMKLAVLLCSCGQHAEAERIMRKVVADADEKDGPAVTAREHAYLGRVLWSAGKRDAEAAKEFGKTLIPLRGTLDPNDYSVFARDAICVTSARGDKEALVRWLNELLSVAEEEGDKCWSLPARQAMELARLVDLNAAFVLSFARQVDDANKTKFQTRAFELCETLRGAALQTAFVFARTANDEKIRECRARANLAHAQLQAIVHGRVDGEPDDKKTIEATEAVIDATKKSEKAEFEALRLALNQRHLDIPRVTVAQLQKQLADNHAIICYRRVEQWEVGPAPPRVKITPHLLAHVVTKKGLQQLDLGDANEVGKLAEQWYDAIQAGATREMGRPGGKDGANAAAALSGKILRPVFDGLRPVLEGLAKSKQPLVLHFCLDDQLHRVPLEALPNPTGQEFIGEQFTVLFENSLHRLIAPEAPPAGPNELLAVGGIAYDRTAAAASSTEPGSTVPPPERGGMNFDELKSTGKEIDAIKKIHEEQLKGKATLLRDADATKSAFLGMLKGKRFVHIATHGHFHEQEQGPLARQESLFVAVSPDAARFDPVVRGFAPMTLCYLVFAGANVEGNRSAAKLTAEELVGQDLSACELAVLSACHGSSGEQRPGQGRQSLQTALHVAGARSVISTRWKVPDEATAQLMEHFYTEHWKNKKPKAEALALAKKWLREQGGDEGKKLKAWAAFVLTGDPR